MKKIFFFPEIHDLRHERTRGQDANTRVRVPAITSSFVTRRAATIKVRSLLPLLPPVSFQKIVYLVLLELLGERLPGEAEFPLV